MCLRSEYRVLMSYYVSLRSEYRVVMSYYVSLRVPESNRKIIERGKIQ